MTIKEIDEKITKLKNEIVELKQTKKIIGQKWIVAVSDEKDKFDFRVIINLSALSSEIKKDIIKVIEEGRTWFSLTPYGEWGTAGFGADGGLKFYRNTKVIFPFDETNAENER